jgi:hypothetical protein
MANPEQSDEFSAPAMRDAAIEEGMSPVALWISALVLNKVALTARRIDVAVRKVIKNSNEREIKIIAEIRRRGL